MSASSITRPAAPAADDRAVELAPRTNVAWHAAVLRALAAVAVGLCLGVVVLGAYVRLSNAGLGCPDWPGCYGHLTPTAAAPALGKAWREMVHRYAAGTLASLLVLIALIGFRWRSECRVSGGYLTALVGVVLVQALLGMLTVTWQLTPIVVTLHLLFGLTTLALLWWLTLTLWQRGSPAAMTAGPPARTPPSLRTARALALLALILLAMQIALGGWTSSNYAAIACPDFPTCQARWWPHADFRSAFVLWRDLGIDYEGGTLTGPARIAIHLTHRLGAAAATLALLTAALFCLRPRLPAAARGAAAVVLLLLALQLSIGIGMVLHGFPLWLATAHNAGAALLLLGTVALNRQLWPRTALAL